MKRFLLLALCMFALHAFCVAKPIKVSTTPTDVTVYLDGKWFADETPIEIQKIKGDFIELRFEKPGYETMTRRLYKSAKQTSYTLTLIEDPVFANTVESEKANRFYTINVSPKYIEQAGGNTKKAAEYAWKMLHQVLLNYFDEIETSDQLSGRIVSGWNYTKFMDAGKQVRTRVIVQETNVGGELTYKVKIVSETGSVSAYRDDAFKPIPRVIKRFDPIIEEFQSRLGVQ